MTILFLGLGGRKLHSKAHDSCFSASEIATKQSPGTKINSNEMAMTESLLWFKDIFKRCNFSSSTVKSFWDWLKLLFTGSVANK